METGASQRSSLARRRESSGVCSTFGLEGGSPVKRRREGDERMTSSLVTGESSNTAGKVCRLGGHLDAPNDLRSILGNMMDDPQLGSLCDVVIVVGGQKFPAHRAVLAAVSRVFKAMFTTCMKEKNAKEVVLSSLDPKSWKMAMQYIYHAQVDINDEESALLLLSSARMYQLEKLERFVENFLCSTVTVCNCFALLAEAERYDLMRLRDVCFLIMEDQFGTLAASPAFLTCPYEVLSRLIGSGHLMIKTEMDVLDAVTRWVESMEEERMKHLDALLGLVRLENLSEEQLKLAGRNSVARKSAKFREQAFERLIYTSDSLKRDSILQKGSHLKLHQRDARVFTFAYMQRGMFRTSHADDDEIVRTPWAADKDGRQIWRLKIYPRGYSKAKGQFLSMYVQGRSALKSEKLEMFARFDIFLVNAIDATQTVIFSSQHQFTENSDHWGFHRFMPLPQLTNSRNGFLDEETDSVVVGVNLYQS